MLRFGSYVVVFFYACLSWAQTNTACEQMNPICTSVGVSFTANANSGTAEIGNNYGCLSTQPNPSWYYFEIATNGTIDMSLSAASDIDFIIYGPFSDLAAATSNCGTLGNATNSPIVDCSYSGTNMETPSIPNTVAGEVYIMLITNYASIVQDITLTQTGGAGSTNCGIVPPCNSAVGTFSVLKNNQLVTGPIALCEGDNFEIRSNGNYILPADTIAAPNGDGIYTAQLLFLVYDAMPIGNDPSTDAGFTQLVIPNDSLFDIHDNQSEVITTLGCGTYYFVPVTADDGIGANNNMAGVNDNGTVFWDTDGNGCYILGTPIEVKYTCPLNPQPVISCTGLNNGINFFLEQAGNYTVVNNGDGNLVSSAVATPDSIRIQNLQHLDQYNISVTNQDGCTDNVTGQFITPQFASVTMLPGPDCPGTGNGSVYVEGIANSGNGGLSAIAINGVLETLTIPFDSAEAAVGSSVLIRLFDQEGCYQDSSVTVTSVGHNVVIELLGTTDALCFGEASGTATINAFTVDGNGMPDNVSIVGIDWSYVPTGATTSGDETDTTNINMFAGSWIVTVTDAIGCSSSLTFEIESPDILELYIQASNDPVCNGQSNGSINIGFTGGTVSSTSSIYDWTGPILVPTSSQTANLLPSGNYAVTLTDENGCAASISHTLNNPPLISADFIVKNVNCYGDSTGSILVSNVVNGFAPFTYNWTLPGLPLVPISNNKVEDLPAGTYVLELTDTIGCSNAFVINITEQDSIFFNELTAFSAFCRITDGQFGNGVLLADAQGGTGTLIYEWTELSTGQVINTSTWASRNPGLYQIKLEDNLECVKLDTILLDSLNPEAIFTLESGQFVAPGIYEGTEPVSVNFTNESINTTNPSDPNSSAVYHWSLYRNGTLAEQNWFFTTSLDDKVDTTYRGEQVYQVCLVAQNYNGCKDTACVDITVRAFPEFLVPNIFTPGQEPNANFFFPSEGMQDFKAVFYNRYGIVVQEFDSIDNFWDGTNSKNGQDCADGVYFYTYEGEATNGTRFKGEGNVTLIRAKN